MVTNLLEATGVIDGVNRDFSAPEAYEPGSLRVLRNGNLLARYLANGWEEVDPALGTFRLRSAPKIGDSVFIFYGRAG